MSSTKPKAKRLAPSTPPPAFASSMIVKTGLFECYDFISPNEYSDKTFGLLAFLLRYSVGEINFSSILDEMEKRNEQGSVMTILEEKRAILQPIDASIEKCLMLNRLISYMNRNKETFTKLLSDIRLDIKSKLTVNPTHSMITYPDDFRQRERDFNNRRNAQDMRRLFYLAHHEVNSPPSLLHLQNKTTEHLNYIIDTKMRYESKFRDEGIQELGRIFKSSFMIITQPHVGVHPVTVYDRKSPNALTAKISVILVSLLHDFMQTHPNLIELYDIEVSFGPSSKPYKLDESQILSWKTCELQLSPGGASQRIHYAELFSIIIPQPNQQSNNRPHLSDVLHTLVFAIKLHLNLPEYKISKAYPIPLQTSPFAIVSNNCYIPYMTTQILVSDIQRFSQRSSSDMSKVSNFIFRYFIHRTGVAPSEHLKDYVKHELNIAMNQRKNSQTLDIFMNFLVPFVHQVEFMAKHPIISMFYADRLFLGICNSDRAAEAMYKSFNQQSPIVGLRMNSIRSDYSGTGTSASSCKNKKFECAVRIDIHNKYAKRLQYRTFETTKLANDISDFISTVHAGNVQNIQVLSSLDNNTNQSSRPLMNFDLYYDRHLIEICKMNEKYKPLTDILVNIEHRDGDNDSPHDNDNDNFGIMFAQNPHSAPPSVVSESNQTYVSNGNSTHEFTLSPIAPSMVNEQNVLSPSQPISNQHVVEYALSQPEVLAEVLRRINMQQQVQQSQVQTQLGCSQQQPVTSPLTFNQTNYENQCQQLQPSSNVNNQQFAQQNQDFMIFEDNEIPSTTDPFVFTDQTSAMVTDLDLFDEVSSFDF